MSKLNTGNNCRQSFIPQALAVLCQRNRKSNDDKHYMYEDKAVIGRSPTAFLCLTESFISRKHCIIEKTEDNKFTICDLSISGTYINGKRLTKNKPQDLNNEDIIRLGENVVYSYVFYINRKLFGDETQEVTAGTSLREEMIDLNETQNLQIESMDKELNLVESEMFRLKEELQEKLKDREVELERERLQFSIESAQNKKQAETTQIKLKEIMEEKDRVMKEYEEKITDFAKKAEELQNTKNEMEKRHQIEREELESKCKAEVEELKKKLEKSEFKHKQIAELENRLKEIKNVVMESELEQQRLFEAKVEVETKLESKILDLTNETENKEEQVKELKIRLKEKEEQEERVKKEIEGLEDDMMCSICAEFYIEPTALNCGHMFCKLCITEWSKKKKICPMCRAKLLTTVRLFNMDSVIERNIRLMSEEVQSRREALIAERKKGKKTPQKRKSTKKRRRLDANFRLSSPEPVAPVRMRLTNEMYEIRVFESPSSRRSPTFIPPVDVPRESEGDDPWQAGWVTNQPMRNVRHTERSSPVTVAAIDLTNVQVTSATEVARHTSSRHPRTHTVTSADVNTTIDLTDI